MKIDVAYDDRLLEWKGSAASPVRAKLAVESLERMGADIDVHSIDRAYGRVRELKLVHDAEYVRRELETEQGQVAQLMFAATSQLLDPLIDAAEAGVPWVGFSPQGAKHHAMWNYSSGFCTFNDMAYAARVLTARGERVAYVDFDAHHGDGVEALTYHDSHIFTASIHEWGIFPETGLRNAPEQNVWNWPLDTDSGDVDLIASIGEVITLVKRFEPTVLLIAAGADGHVTDPLSSLRYTLPGYERVARALAWAAADTGATRVLIGGAGGYQPDDVTPEVWATFVDTFATTLEEATTESGVHVSRDVIQ